MCQWAIFSSETGILFLPVSITETMRLKGTSGGPLAGSAGAGCSRPCPVRFLISPSTETTWRLGQPVPLLDYPHWGFFIAFRWNFLCFNLYPLPLILAVCCSESGYTFSSHPPSCICTHWQGVPWAFFSPGWPVELPQSLLVWEML